MLLIASRRKLSQRRWKKRRKSNQTHYLKVTSDGPAKSTELATDVGQATWLTHVEDAGAAQGVTIFIHGFNTEQNTMLTRYYNLKRNVRFHGFSGAVIAFDWPNFDNVMHYSSDRDLAGEVAPFLLSDVVAPILNKVPGAKINIVAHSMGAWLTMRALEELAKGTVPGLNGFCFHQICFVSADVSVNDVKANTPGWTALTGHCTRTTNYCSSQDRVLSGVSKVVNGMVDRLGQAGLPVPVSGETLDVEAQNRFTHFKKRDSRRHSHTWWFEDAFFFKDLSKTLQGHTASQVASRMTAHAPPKQMLRAQP